MVQALTATEAPTRTAPPKTNSGDAAREPARLVAAFGQGARRFLKNAGVQTRSVAEFPAQQIRLRPVTAAATSLFAGVIVGSVLTTLAMRR